MTLNKKKFILDLYEEYLCEKTENKIIDIVPVTVSRKSKDIAYTYNDELEQAILNSISANLYYKDSLFKSNEIYVKAIFYHEFVHISDFKKVRFLDNMSLVMSIFSEYNAMKTEFEIRCSKKDVGLDDKIFDQDGYTTPRKYIEGNIAFIISLVEAPKEKITDEMEGIFIETFIRHFPWTLAVLSFYEYDESEYIVQCFNKFNSIYLKENVIMLYDELKCFDYTNDKGNELVMNMMTMCTRCFEL